MHGEKGGRGTGTECGGERLKGSKGGKGKRLNNNVKRGHGKKERN